MIPCYSASKIFLDVADDGYCKALIKNPINSGIIAQLYTGIGGEGKAYIHTYSSPSYSDIGLTATPVNRDGTAGLTKLEIYYSPTITDNGTLRVEDILFGGTGQKSIGSISQDNIITRITPGQELLLIIQNKGDAAKDFVLSIYWNEVNYNE